MPKVSVLVEVQTIHDFSRNRSSIVAMTSNFLEKYVSVFVEGTIPILSHDVISQHVSKIEVIGLENRKVSFWQADLFILPFYLIDQQPEKEKLGDSSDEDTPSFGNISLEVTNI
jgi:hypothetical protein